MQKSTIQNKEKRGKNNIARKYNFNASITKRHFYFINNNLKEVNYFKKCLRNLKKNFC